jgi:hypothetical protein
MSWSCASATSNLPLAGGGLAISSPSSILPDHLVFVLALCYRVRLLLLVPLEVPAQQDKLPILSLRAQRLAHSGSIHSLFVIEFMQENWGYRSAQHYHYQHNRPNISPYYDPLPSASTRSASPSPTAMLILVLFIYNDDDFTTALPSATSSSSPDADLARCACENVRALRYVIRL